MAWVAVDQTNDEYIFESEPTRWEGAWWDRERGEQVELPQGTIKKLIGKELTWSDDPVELQ